MIIKSPKDAAKYAELLLALSQGKTIQSKISPETTWYDIRNTPAFDYTPDSYRVKPDPFWYRVAKFKNTNYLNRYMYIIITSDMGSFSEEGTEKTNCFIEWITPRIIY